MAKNRRKNKRVQVRGRKQNVHGVIPGTLFGALVLLAGFALAYLYICGRSVALGNQITALEKKHASLRREIVNEEYKWNRALTPDNMQKLLVKHNLEMIWPSEDSVVRLPRNPPPHFGRQYAESAHTGIAHD